MIDKTKDIKFEKYFNYLVANGEYYEWKSKDGKPLLEHVPKEKVEAKLAKVKEITAKIKDGLDAEKVLTETLMTRLEDRDVDKLLKLVNSQKKTYVPRTRSGHCVDMRVGKFIIPLVD